MLKENLTDKELVGISNFLSYRIMNFSEKVIAKRKKYLPEQNVRELMIQSKSLFSVISSIFSDFTDSGSFNTGIMNNC